MTFLNAILLGGLAAAVLPVAIHLLNRNRHQVRRWGAMHLLEQVLRSNRRRLKIEQLVLLLVRISIPLFLALCLARPVLTWMRTLLGNARSSVVVLLDNSYSLEAGDATRSRFTAARDEVDQILASLPRGSEAAVLGLAGPIFAPGEEAGSDLSRLRRTVATGEGGFGKADVPRTLEAAAGVFASRMHQADRMAVVVSDFQKVSWGTGEAGARRRVLDLLAAQPVRPEIILFPIGTGTPGNLAVESLELSRSLVGVRQPLRIRANLRNFGSESYPDLRVYFRVDGKEKSAVQVSLGPGARDQVLFTHEFDRAGSHVLDVTADADSLKADNSLLLSVPVVDRIPVLLVSGDLNPEPLAAETAFLELALQPFNATRNPVADLIATKVIPEAQLTAGALAEAKVAVLANVRALTDDQRGALEAFVRDGGGLLVFPGDRLNIGWYNEKLAADNRALLPARFLALAGSEREGETPATLVVRHYEHPALALFNDPRNGSLTGAEIRAWYRLEDPRRGGTAAPPGVTVAAELDSGDPFLIARELGDGRVIQCAIPADADWSNLPLRPFYLPLMQELVTWLAANVYPPRNVEPGQNLTAFLPVADVDKPAALVDPQGKRHGLRVTRRGSRGVLEFRGTTRPGLYVLEPPGGSPLHFVVNVPRAESDLTALSSGELQTLAKDMNARIVRSWKDFRNLDQQRRNGQELWPALLWVVVGLMFVELLLEQYFARRRF